MDKFFCWLLSFFYPTYHFQRFSKNISPEGIADLKKVAMGAIGRLPDNPIFDGKGIENKIVMVVYARAGVGELKTPIAVNIMFDYVFQNKRCLHIGLVLVDQKYQGKGIQKILIWNAVLYMAQYFYTTIFMTDLGRSASGLRLWNENFPNSFPFPGRDRLPTPFYIEWATYFYNRFKTDCVISEESEWDPQTFIIRRSNQQQGGGAHYLVGLEETRRSRNELYNQFIDALGPEDEVLAVGSTNIFAHVGKKLFSFITK
jgi:GNAT superfamily N-acetyltransferase